jgi:hypothetical protein
MHRCIRAALGAATAALACLVFRGVSSAAPATFAGTVANGGCDSGHAVTVSGPSRIEAHISSTSPANTVYTEIVSPSGSVAATGRYDTPASGTYNIRVCSTFDAMNAPTLEWSGVYATGPAGQSALTSQAQNGVFAATQTLSHDIHGTAAIRTRAGLAWFTVKLDQNGAATVKVFGPALKKHYLFTGATATFGTSTVRITQGGMTLTLVQVGGSDRIVFHSLRFKASGMVVRGGYVVA